MLTPALTLQRDLEQSLRKQLKILIKRYSARLFRTVNTKLRDFCSFMLEASFFVAHAPAIHHKTVGFANRKFAINA